MTKKSIISIIASIVALLVVIALIGGGLGKNDAPNWQVIQGVGGKITIRDKAGWYPKWFATVTTYPRFVSVRLNDILDDGDASKESIRTTFNDGGIAQISTDFRYSTPIIEKSRKIFHQQFSGNIVNATIAVKSHLTNCIKATGPLMSASENQSSRKAEYTQLVWNQLEEGLYKMKRVEVEVEVDVDMALVATESKTSVSPSKTKEVRITTNLLLDKDGNPLIAKESPLIGYDIGIVQFSVTGTEYDSQTLVQFATKKQSYLAAEQSKADREKEKQERLNIIEKGLREVAEAQAAGNVAKETAVVAAQLKAEVAMQAKLEAETKAEMALSVSTTEKMEAQIKLDKAELDAQAVIVLAKAEQEKINLAGAITELEQAMIDAQVQMATNVAEHLSKIPVPLITMGGGSGAEGGDGGMMKSLINLKLMTDSGILEKMGIDKSIVDRSIDRTEE